MTSARLPGKTLMPFAASTILGEVLTGVAGSTEVDGYVVATSTDRSDDPIAAWASERGVRVIRGSLTDVAGRVLEAARKLDASAVVRVSADSPFIDPAIIDHAVRLFRQSGADLATNVFPRSFPRGQSVEVLQVAALSRAIAAGLSATQAEHVTAVFYENPDEFEIVNFAAADQVPGLGAGADFSSVRLSVDTAEDLASLTRAAEHFLRQGSPRPRWADLAGSWGAGGVSRKEGSHG